MSDFSQTNCLHFEGNFQNAILLRASWAAATTGNLCLSSRACHLQAEQPCYQRGGGWRKQIKRYCTKYSCYEETSTVSLSQLCNGFCKYLDFWEAIHDFSIYFPKTCSGVTKYNLSCKYLVHIYLDLLLFHIYVNRISINKSMRNFQDLKY